MQLRKLVCDKCGEFVEFDTFDLGEPDAEGHFKTTGGFVFCPKCWKQHLQTVKEYVMRFSSVMGVELPPQHAKNTLAVSAMIMQDVLNDLRLTHNRWGISVRKESEPKTECNPTEAPQ